MSDVVDAVGCYIEVLLRPVARSVIRERNIVVYRGRGGDFDLSLKVIGDGLELCFCGFDIDPDEPCYRRYVVELSDPGFQSRVKEVVCRYVWGNKVLSR